MARRNQQAYGFDAIDRLTSGPSGAMTYDPTHVHAAIMLGQVPNQYASYDAMGNMTCRNVDTTTTHSCDATQSGAQLTYDSEGRLDTWTSPTSTGASTGDQFLYDNAGNRVLQRATVTTSGSTSATDTIYFDGYTETAINGGTTSTVKYYAANGQRIAMKQGTTLTYLVSDLLGNSTLALKSDGTLYAAQLFSPFGSVRYSDSTMPNSFSFTGQRLDSQTGLLYYNFRYYDPVSGRFTRTDTQETNAVGMDTYGYVHGNPETMGDLTGHWGWGTVCGVLAVTAGVIAGVVIAAAIVGAVTTVGIVVAPVVLGAAIGIAGAFVISSIVGYKEGAFSNVDNFDAWGGSALLSEAIGGVAGGLGAGAGEAFQAAGESTNMRLVGSEIVTAIPAKAAAMGNTAVSGIAGIAGGAVGAIIAQSSYQNSSSHQNHTPKLLPKYLVPTSTWYDTVDAAYYKDVNSGIFQGSTTAQNSWHQQANWSYLNQRRVFFGI